MSDRELLQLEPHSERARLSSEALLEVSKAIALHRDLPALIHDLLERLPRLVTFDSLWLVLHDPSRNTMRLHILETGAGAAMDLVERPVDESPSGWVWSTQQPRLVRDLDQEVGYDGARSLLRDRGVRSYCLLPLSTAHRRLGALGFGRREGAYEERDVVFLSQLARHVAVAVDNALSHQEAQRLQRQLEQERDRLRLLLELNNSLVSHLDLNQLFRAISTHLRRVARCDAVSLLLPDPDGEHLRIRLLDDFEARGPFHEGMLFPLEGSASGLAFRTGKPVAVNDVEAARQDPELYGTPQADEFYSLLVGGGIKAAAILPLISEDQVLGVLALSMSEARVFCDGDMEFLGQVATQVAIAVENALDYQEVAESRQRLEEERLYLNEEIRIDHNFEEIIGESAALKRALKQVETVAPTDSTVLILGETGTGKELIARAIHNLSRRRSATFVKVNCAAIPLGLLESELFGHEKGAFTGAIAQKIGRFELAHQGTLFLDEIGDIPLELQPKLLRVLQEQEFERLGSVRTTKVNVRLVAATARDLRQMVAQRQFRDDLFYRLNVFPITIPPLRERPEDIPLLAHYFVDLYSRRMNKPIRSISRQVLEALVNYDWPGNVRELQNFAERAVILSEGAVLRIRPGELKASTPRAPAQARTLEEAEREHILRALRDARWVLGGPKGAATRLGLKRTTLFYKMRRLGLSRSTEGQPRRQRVVELTPSSPSP